MSDVASPPRPIPSLPLARADGHDADSDGAICRAEVAADIEPLTWLAGRSEGELCYWASRDGGDEAAAAGLLLEEKGLATAGSGPWMGRIAAHLQTAADGVRFYGGARFDPSAPAAPEWRMLGAHRFVIPRFEALTRNGRTMLACNFLHAERERLPALLDELQRPSTGPEDQPEIRLRRHTDVPDRAGWKTIVHTALRAINDPSDLLNKVVIARRTSASTVAPITPLALLAAMSRAGDRSFRFLLQTCHNNAFLSVTPERLFSLHGRTVQTEAIAGTRPRGATPQEDRRLQCELGASAKDLLEHRIVHDTINAALIRLCTATTASSVTVLRLPAVQHLMSRLSGELTDGLGAADLMNALHPTPAVGGEPTAKACQFLAEHEPFDRGWYAAPVGWISRDEATFAVAIRSALIDDGAVSFYTGNGVVKGSSPDAEWAELEAKIGGYFAPSG